MNTLYALRRLLDPEEGQDLVEYALVMALITFGSVASMHYLAGGINNAFSELAATVTSNIS